MKELSIEEKAKSYDEALERAKKELKTCGSMDCDAAKQIFRFFPELKESENERIRKALIKSYTNQHSSNFPTVDGLSREQILAWLEKQGEQKPADKTEPTVGDWVVVAGKVAQILDIQENYTVFHDSNGKNFLSDYPFYLWTIQDAKDGDVIAYPDNTIVLFKNLHKGEDEGVFAAHCLYVDNKIEGMTTCAVANIHPATKEQCDLLFQKMKEAGYEWDAEKKELKKIEKKPAWSEDDEKKFRDVIRLVEQGAPVKSIRDHYTSWLKSLKDRVFPQLNQELSDDVTVNEYVDLGLPSGTLWKSFNETNPNDDKHDFYTYDEAMEKFGDQLPTEEQFKELKECCRWVWADNGYNVTGPNGNSIFLPANGYSNVIGCEYYVGMGCSYWSSISSREGYAQSLYCNPSWVGMSSDPIYDICQSVRLVK